MMNGSSWARWVRWRLSGWQTLGHCRAERATIKREKYAWLGEEEETGTKADSRRDERHYRGL